MVSLYILKHMKTEEEGVKRLAQHAKALQQQTGAAACTLHALHHALNPLHSGWRALVFLRTTSVLSQAPVGQSQYSPCTYSAETNWIKPTRQVKRSACTH